MDYLHVQADNPWYNYYLFDNQLHLCSRHNGSSTRNVARLRFKVLLDFSLTVKAATLIFIFGRGSAISSAKEGKSGFIYNVVKSKYAF